ncbi:YwqJ-related putative deaminase [Saccharopolyspora sp. 7B]|uniref:YwqJ-related putative deaminase n=1 Tax=Saccharopolyspora sp. 7B TaxID=2877240 RepID=UPI001CD6602F|nr:YwqJ-related putative deaminase [Saccharopolyspora sp. 7B]MCA1281822.1 hypothetical protein [Saccharopolyspora sp. 7B]
MGQELERVGAQDDTRHIDYEGGVITHIDGSPVHQYVRDSVESRQQGIQNAVEDNFKGGKLKRDAPHTDENDVPYTKRSLGKVRAAVNAVAIDRRTGVVAEGINGTPDKTPLNRDLHPELRKHIAAMSGNPAQTDLSDIPQSEFPHHDTPQRHAEVKALNELMRTREKITGDSIDSPEKFQEFLDDVYVDARFTFKDEPHDIATCCANCARIVSGPDSLPANKHDEADLSAGATMAPGGYTIGEDPERKGSRERVPTEVANPDYHEPLGRQNAARKAR